MTSIYDSRCGLTCSRCICPRFLYIYVKPRSWASTCCPALLIYIPASISGALTAVYGQYETSAPSSIHYRWPGILSNLESIGFPVLSESPQTVPSHSGSLVALMCDELSVSNPILVQMNWFSSLYTLLTIFRILWAESTKNGYAVHQRILGFVSRLHLCILFLVYGRLSLTKMFLKFLTAPKLMDRRDSMMLAGLVASYYLYTDDQHFRIIHNIHGSKTRL